MKYRPFFFAFLTCLLTSFSYASIKKVKPNKRLIPAVEIYNFSNKHTILDKISRGKVTIIDCWFIPCPPCFKEMEIVHELYYKYRNSKDVQVISICRSDTAVFRKFIEHDPNLKNFTTWFHELSKQKNFALPTYFLPGCNERIFTNDGRYPPKAPDNKSKCPDNLFGFKGYPTLIISNKRGEIIFKKTGYLSEQKEQLRQTLNKTIHNALAKL